MDFILYLKALILGIIEGLTEFLPISSTGHLILVGDLLNFTGEKSDVFKIAIQLAAILAVCWEYRARLSSVALGLVDQPAARRFVLNLLIAFLPAAILGVLFIKVIKSYLFAPLPVATALIVGGLLILWAEKRQHTIRIQAVEEMGWKDALKVGLAQSLAMIPGTSRSGATIIGGLFFGLSRKAATEFSFFLAIPTMFGATVYDVYKHRELFVADDLGLFLVGGGASFVSAFFAVRALLHYVSRHDFTLFAWYRIAFGVVVLLTAWSGLVNWSI
ncbi:MAG TPA: undecaprenyl-diphosphate phosphatase [Gammaproteobacteria bacterium]